MGKERAVEGDEDVEMGDGDWDGRVVDGQRCFNVSVFLLFDLGSFLIDIVALGLHTSDFASGKNLVWSRVPTAHVHLLSASMRPRTTRPST